MLEISDIYKSYEGQPLLRGVSFSVAASETVCLLGPSGGGKSTLLRIIAGLEACEQGVLRWDGVDLAAVPAHRRNFGLMFQDYALFPHLNVAENIAFGLKMQKRGLAETNERTRAALAQVNLTGFEKRRVTDLSGGEQQRVALARALAPEPRLLMLDEPLGALDRNLREQLMAELRSTLRQTGVPVIYVTHDQEEAFTLADRVLLLHAGEIVQGGAPDEIHARPVSTWVAQFLGLGNVVKGEVRRLALSRSPEQSEGEAEGMKAERWEVETEAGEFTVACGHKHEAGEKVLLLIRPAGAQLSSSGLTGVVVDVVFQQEHFKVTLDNGLYFHLPAAPQIGRRIALSIPASAIQCLGR